MQYKTIYFQSINIKKTAKKQYNNTINFPNGITQISGLKSCTSQPQCTSENVLWLFN